VSERLDITGAPWGGLNLYSYPSGVGEGASGTGAIRLGQPDFDERTLRVGAHGNIYHKIVEIESQQVLKLGPKLPAP
jgi:hypothetical protein